MDQSDPRQIPTKAGTENSPANDAIMIGKDLEAWYSEPEKDCEKIWEIHSALKEASAIDQSNLGGFLRLRWSA
ncbi:uncharacterized protein ColSpa_08954 [Colletotrichum spaethianum]|uniref:Uncharacterized protein n=1 Tax=Colletotrichum spaethianum TaxID=700344 RepID=A0AA37PAP0_9PEZI|nr:uncharacterized protein ColSpa_08954 [Colletotrichum spaethianum]GKT48773.1 hypothetical protein ColSpa_08954 [Colletotrichum spaethianum]